MENQNALPQKSAENLKNPNSTSQPTLSDQEFEKIAKAAQARADAAKPPKPKTVAVPSPIKAMMAQWREMSPEERQAQREREITAANEREARRKQSEKEERTKRLIDSCETPEKYRHIKGGGPLTSLGDLSDVPEKIREHYANVAASLKKLSDVGGDSSPIVALLGRRGLGKTHMACALIHDFCRRCKSARYADATDYFLRIRGTFGRKGVVTELDIEEQFVWPDLLVLDEMHERGETPWEDRMLTRLINKRYASMRSTVLISNQNKKEFTERIGESIASRIMDGGGMILCDWESLRGKI